MLKFILIKGQAETISQLDLQLSYLFVLCLQLFSCIPYFFLISLNQTLHMFALSFHISEGLVSQPGIGSISSLPLVSHLKCLLEVVLELEIGLHHTVALRLEVHFVQRRVKNEGVSPAHIRGDRLMGQGGQRYRFENRRDVSVAIEVLVARYGLQDRGRHGVSCSVKLVHLLPELRTQVVEEGHEVLNESIVFIAHLLLRIEMVIGIGQVQLFMFILTHVDRVGGELVMLLLLLIVLLILYFNVLK